MNPTHSPLPSPLTQPTQHVDTFYVLDFDKTLGDILTIYDLFVKLLISLGVADADHLVDLRTRVESMGGSFDVVTCLMSEGRVDAESFASIRARFVTELQHVDVLLPGAKELLTLLRSRDDSFGILTYGGQQWQDTKIEAAGLGDIPRIVTQTKEKGRLISQWQRTDGSYVIPPALSRGMSMTADTVLLVDDKAASFDGLPTQRSGGYHVLDEMTAVDSQRGSVPQSVTRVSTLFDVARLVQ